MSARPDDDLHVFCCENFSPLAWQSGLFNLRACVTSVPMWLVPLRALRLSFRNDTSLVTYQDLSSMRLWLMVLTVLYVSGTVQHALGPADTPALLDPILLGIAQNAFLAGHLAGAPMPLSCSLAAMPAAEAVWWPNEQKRFGEAMNGVLSLYIIGTMGYRSRHDRAARRLFFGALASFVALTGCMALEPKLCKLPGAEYFHATAIHGGIASLHLHVTSLALQLSELGQLQQHKHKGT